MADPDPSTGEEVKKVHSLSEYESKTLAGTPSNTFFENREYKTTTSEKCRSHQTLSFKRNLLDLEFNAAHGDSSTKKCTEDLIDLFERKSTATNSLQVSNEKADSPRKKDNAGSEQTSNVDGKKTKLAIILAETDEDLTASVVSETEDLTKADTFSFDYESTEGTTEEIEPLLEIEDRVSESDFIQSELVDIDKRESISDKLDETHALLVDNCSTEGEVITQQELQEVENDINEDDPYNFAVRIKNLKQSMDEINSMIAIEKDYLREEKLELENSLTLVPVVSGDDKSSFRSSAQYPRKLYEERKLKFSFQMKQLEEAQRRCSSELQMISNTANQVDQLKQDMAVFTTVDRSYMAIKDNNYSLSHRPASTPNRSPNNTPRFPIGSERNPRGSLLSPCLSDINTTPFDRSLLSPIEFTMGDTRLQMQAADHFKMKICQLEAQLNSNNFQPLPTMFPPRRTTREAPLPNLSEEPLKALT